MRFVDGCAFLSYNKIMHNIYYAFFILNPGTSINFFCLFVCWVFFAVFVKPSLIQLNTAHTGDGNAHTGTYQQF